MYLLIKNVTMHNCKIPMFHYSWCPKPEIDEYQRQCYHCAINYCKHIGFSLFYSRRANNCFPILIQSFLCTFMLTFFSLVFS